LIAPFDGVVLERKIEQGESISAGKEVFVLLNLNNLYVDLEINERKLSKIKAGQSIELKTNVYPELITGMIHAVVPAVQGKANVLAVRAKLNKPECDLLPGMFVIAQVIVHTEKNVVSIPLQALSKENGKMFVFVFHEPSKTVLKREVIPGYANHEEMIIQDKLSAGENIVVDTTAPLKDGMTVLFEPERL
jgi:membrane fusion protein (multidrug efflux system)